MTGPPIRTARRIISEFRGGSTLPVLVETTSGARCVVKWKCTGEGPAANAVEWISLHLARNAGLAVPSPCLINITPDLLQEGQDPEINDLISRSIGVNLALEYLRDTVPFDHSRSDVIDPVMKHLIYQCDVLFLNIDRTDLLGEAVGHISYDRSYGIVELDIWLASMGVCGKGYGSDALDVLARHLYETLRIIDCIMRPSQRNRRAIQAYVKAGFVPVPMPFEEQVRLYGPADYPDAVVLKKHLHGVDSSI